MEEAACTELGGAVVDVDADVFQVDAEDDGDGDCKVAGIAEDQVDSEPAVGKAATSSAGADIGLDAPAVIPDMCKEEGQFDVALPGSARFQDLLQHSMSAKAGGMGPRMSSVRSSRRLSTALPPFLHVQLAASD